ncbi:MAG: hypothetical protein WC841_04050 [Candidatus Shapirobacteria bacterium]|jgi:hypothetical protein
MIEKIPDLYREKAFWGTDIGDQQRMQQIDGVAQRINNALNLQGGVVARRRDAELISVVNGLAAPGEWRCDTAQGLVEASRDPQRTVNRDLAERRLDILADAAYIAIKYGDNDGLRTALEEGSVEKIEDQLPRPLKGIGERVRNLEIHNLDIRAILDKLDSRGRGLKAAGEVGKKQLALNLGEAIVKLSNLEDLDVRSDEEMMRVSAYLGAEAEAMGGGVVGGNIADQVAEGVGRAMGDRVRGGEPMVVPRDEAEEDYFRDLAAYQKAQGELQEAVREVSLRELLDSFLGISAPRERGPQMWEYKPPEWIKPISVEDWRKLLGITEKFFVAVYNKRNDSEYGTSVEMVGKKILSMQGLPEKTLKYLFEHRALKLNLVCGEIMRDLMVPMETSPVEVPKQNRDGSYYYATETSRVYVFSSEPNGDYSRSVQRLVDDEVAYKKGMAANLFGNSAFGFRSLESAELAVATAMNIMEMGGVFSLADTKRILGWESDAVRVIQRPETKFHAKLGKELWGGPWGEYLMAVAGGNRAAMQSEAERLGIIPRLLAGSFFDQKVKTEGGVMVKMGEALYQRRRVVLNDVDKDIYFDWRKDQIKAAGGMFLYMTGKAPLEFRTINEVDNVTTKWREELFNDTRALRENGTSVVTTELVAMAIGGSTGVWPFEGPFLRMTQPGPDLTNDYLLGGSEITRLVAGTNILERERLRRFFGIDKSRMGILNRRVAGYRMANEAGQSGIKKGVARWLGRK